ncbi:apolipoprotein B-100 [Engraulis encrasicolus]|uniref:apolipoprotein B-100 n=1 Tax=Engraulis encrasicolus TaxID=184585 RepID=UPI002FD1E53C
MSITGDTKLLLLVLLLLAVQSLADPDSGDWQSSCKLGQRFKSMRKYLYTYTTESRNGVVGTANLKNGPKITCKVELDVRSACSFNLHTSECLLSEVSVIDAQGQPVYRQAAGSEAFQAAMERHDLSFMVNSMTDIELSTTPEEPRNILNIKRGIISALLAPSMDSQDNKKMATVHGVCKTDVSEHPHEDMDTEVFVTRDLFQCSRYSPLVLDSSPLALIQGLHTPLSMLVKGSQECTYQFDNRRKHMNSVQCTENHIFRPFSHHDKYGISSVVTQTLTLEDTAKSKKNGGDLGHEFVSLYFDMGEDKLPVQSKDAVLSTLRDLSGLAPAMGQQRAGLFHRLVAEMRGLRNASLEAAVKDALAISAPLTWQALAQCGTLECRVAMLIELQESNLSGDLTDALVYAMYLVIDTTSGEEVRELNRLAYKRITRPLLYALGFAVKKLQDTSDFPWDVVESVRANLLDLLGDCSVQGDTPYLVMRVIGMIGYRVHDSQTESALLTCMDQPEATPLVQKAAIDAFRTMEFHGSAEPRVRLLQVYQDGNAPTWKRLAAYRIMAKQEENLNTIIQYHVNQEQNPEVKSFVASHLASIWRSQREDDDMRYQFINAGYVADQDAPGKSKRLYHHPIPELLDLESMVIREPNSWLPEEVIFKALSGGHDAGHLTHEGFFEFGMQGEHLDPLLDSLVGDDGLIPKFLVAALKWVGGIVSPELKSLLEKLTAAIAGNRMKRQAPEVTLKELKDIVEKFLSEIETGNSPEVVVYLRLFMEELGYIRASDLTRLPHTIAKYGRLIFMSMPAQAMKSILSGTDNDYFAHYMFMDENMILPTGSGLPLKLSLSGVFAPGAKGGISLSQKMLSFAPSAGLEFVTHMGVYLPEYVPAGIEMHTNMYSEGALDAKVTLGDKQVKISILPPKENVQLLSISNKLLSISSSQPKIVPSIMEDRTDITDCQPLIPGFKLCSITRYSNGSSIQETSYFPLTGESRFAFELMPVPEEATAYSATASYQLLQEGEEESFGRAKRSSGAQEDTVTITFEIEGSPYSDATATLKFNRDKKIFTADFQAPDLDYEVGIRLAAGESKVKGKKMRGFTFDVTNKNIPQLSLVGRARLESLKDAMIQVELDIPSLISKATATASLKKDSGLTVQLETKADIPKTSSVQALILRYDENKVEVELKSELNSDFDQLFPNMEGIRNNAQRAIDDMLDQTVPKTDMKLRHIVSKGFEAVNIWLDKVAADVPSLSSLRSRRSIPELPAVPEKLFLKWATLFRYQFNKDKMHIEVPLLLLLNGMNLDLGIPDEISIPEIDLPDIGLYIPSNTYSIPSFSILDVEDISWPLLGLAELSTEITSSLCSWEASVIGGNNTIDVPSLIGQYKIMSDCLLPFQLEGTGMIQSMDGIDDNPSMFKYLVNNSLSNSLLDASFSISETFTWKGWLFPTYTDRSNYRLQASSPLGVSVSFHSSSQSVLDMMKDILKGDGDMDGDIKVGPLYAKLKFTHSYEFDDDEDAKYESNLNLDSSLIQLQNVINVEATNILLVRSKTTTANDIFTHMLEMKYTDEDECSACTLKSDATAKLAGSTLNNKIDLGLTCDDAVYLKVETEADDGRNRAYSVITAKADDNTLLETNTDGTVVFESCRGSLKSSLNIGDAGLSTGGVASLQCSPLAFENTFNGGIDSDGGTMSLNLKVSGRDDSTEFQVEGKATPSQASLNSFLKGNLFDADILNTMNVGLDRDGLVISDSMKGSLQSLRTESTHSLSATFWTLALRSKTDCFVCDGTSYNHDINVALEPFDSKITFKNDIRLYDNGISNDGELHLAPMKIDLTGTVGAFSADGDSVTQNCNIHYADLAGVVQCHFKGTISDAKFSHDVDLKYAGLQSKFKSEALIDTKILRLQSTLRTMAEPFSLTVDGIVNSDSEVHFYGKHKGQLYSKLLFRAEPFGIAHSHDCRASASHDMPSGLTHETQLENKLEGILTPSEQKWLWKVKSKLNNHAYNQDISTYNNDEKMGIEFAGVVFTNLLNKAGPSAYSFENEEFSLTAFLKYDKNSDSHIFYLPYVDDLPASFEQLKASVVNILQTIQQYIDSLDVNNLCTQFKATLERIPQDVENYIKELDLEGKFQQANAELVSWIQNYAISVDDLETTVQNLREATETIVLDITSKLRDIVANIKDFYSDNWHDILKGFLSTVANDLAYYNDKYGFSNAIMRAIDAIADIIQQIDMEKLKDSSFAWLQDLDTNYEIKDWLQEKVSEIKQALESFDIWKLSRDLEDYIQSFDLNELLGQITDQLPTDDIKNTLETMKDILVNWLDEYDIDGKINSVITKIQDLLQRYEIDKKFEMLSNEFIELIREYNIHETLQEIVDELKKIECEYIFNSFMQILNDVINQLSSIDFKQSIQDLNEHISTTVKAIEDFDYKMQLDDINSKIGEVINYVNEHIKTLEIPEKIEASREFLRGIQSTIWNYLDQLKETRVGELFTMLKDVLEKTAYKDIRDKLQDMLADMRQRVSDMDVNAEMKFYLERASESYTNLLDYISVQLTRMIDAIRQVAKDQELLDEIQNFINSMMDDLKTAEISIESFDFPLTDLTIPDISIALHNLQAIDIPSRIEIPQFDVLIVFEVPSITLDFEEWKQKIIETIDEIRAFELPIVEIDAIFGDLRVLYMFDLPDLTFPEYVISEIKIPVITLPKLNCQDFEITKLPIPEVKLPEIPSDVQVPAFGKLYGEIRINSPHYTLVTEAALENSTTASKSPQFTATLTSDAKSTFKLLEFTLDGTLRLEAPRMKKMVFKETLKLSHVSFQIDHEGNLIFSGPSAEATAKTTAKATMAVYTADLENTAELSLKNGISFLMNTNYNHNLNVQNSRSKRDLISLARDISSQMTMTQTAKAQLESGTITLTVETMGSGKASVDDFSDEGTHNSKLEFNVNIGTAKLTFSGETKSKALSLKQDVNIESVSMSDLTVSVLAETETPFIKSSQMTVKGIAEMENLKIDLAVDHNAELIGKVSGTISNSLEFLAKPFEIVLDCKNKANTKIQFPLKLTGKLDLQNDYGFILNSEKQRVCLVGLARFNQYKYNHNFTLDNNPDDMGIYGEMNSEANLDFLTVPVTIPEMTLPYFEVKTPMVAEFSLWEDAGLNHLLTTPRQSFAMDLKLQYQKNPDTHALYFDLAPVYSMIQNEAQFLRENFEVGRNWVFENLMSSYNQAKSQYEKFQIDTSSQPPKYFRIPGYTIPVLNIQVSAFSAEMPAFSYLIPKEVSTPSFKVPALGFSVPSYTLVLPSLQLPVLHVPETLAQLTLPDLLLPEVQNSILIPAMGNTTLDFSFKSAVITLIASGGLYNQSDIVAKLEVTSTSVFDILKSKFEGTTSLAMDRGKLATSMTLEHIKFEGKHESSLSCTSSLEVNSATFAKVNLPILTLEADHNLNVYSHGSPNFVSELKGNHNFNIPYINAVGNGDFGQKVNVAVSGIFMSLTNQIAGKITGSVMDTGNFEGGLQHEADIYIKHSGVRSKLGTLVKTKIDQDNISILNIEVNEDFALEASLRRVYSVMTCTCTNKANIASFSTNGDLSAKVTLEMVPLTTVLIDMDLDIVQPSNIGDAEIVQKIDLDITAEKQSLKWSGREQIISIVHACDLVLSNDKEEARIEATQSWEAHLAFLQSIKLPVYQKTLWDVLKFDQVTSVEQRQFFNASTSVVYTKSADGFMYGYRDVIRDLYNINQILEYLNLEEYFEIPYTFFIPSFGMEVDLRKIEEIPDSLTTPEINLPGPPEVNIPSLEIVTKHHLGNRSHIYVKIPAFEITISQIRLPQVFYDVWHALPACGVPLVEIPKMSLEMPEISFNIPTSILIPVVGSLSTTVKVASPIYTETWTTVAKFHYPEQSYAELVTSLRASCTSTMTFLEYNLDAKATWQYYDGLSINGVCKLTHSDFNIDWQHTLTQNTRVKRQDSQDVSSRHTLYVDITSPTFVDVSCRYASHKNGITASVSSPSAGFMGIQLQRRSPSQYYGKVFGRYPSSPDKDTDMVTVKATLRNSEKLSLQVAWNWNTVSDILYGVKQNTPGIVTSLKRCVNKYHTAHFGMDLNRASLKLKNSLSNTIERTYHEAPQILNSMQNSLEELSQQTREAYKRAADQIPYVDLQEMRNRFSDRAREVYENYEKTARVLIDASLQFLRETKFHLPGLEEKLSGQELYHRVRIYVSDAITEATNAFIRLMETICSYIRSVEITLPFVDKVLRGQEIVDSLPTVDTVEQSVKDALDRWENLRLQSLLHSVNDFLRHLIMTIEEALTSLQSVQLEDFIVQLKNSIEEAGNVPAIEEIKLQIIDAKKHVGTYKDVAKMKVQDVYNEFTLENINQTVVDALDVFESHFLGGANEFHDLLRHHTQDAEPYIKIYNKKAEVEIPLPFFWKSFNDWPTQTRE